MYTIELDTTYNANENIAQVIAQLTAGTSVQGEVVQEHGPAGGWPVVRYTGSTKDELLRVAWHYGYDAMEHARKQLG